MLTVMIPGHKTLELSHLVLDYNGTLALDGLLLEGVKPRLNQLAEKVTVHILTGDGFGTAKKELVDINCQLEILPAENQATAKEKYIEKLAAEQFVAIGNGRNDKKMLEKATLSMIVIGNEGCAKETLMVADIVVPHILAALDLLQYPLRLKATLRG